MEAKGLTIDNLFYRINKQTKERILIQLTATCIMDIKSNGANSSFIYEPIPLTEQVLVDCGFEKLKSDYEEAETWDFYYGILYFDMANNSVKINSQYCLSNIPEYLHQLQNLYFALTGQELEYKPKK